MTTEDAVVARDADGRVLLRRPKSPLELAMEIHGEARQVDEWQVHPACANPPVHSGVCTYRFADGLYWCFGCGAAWEA